MMTIQDRIIDGIHMRGHDLSTVGDPSEYGGLRVDCSCGWSSRVVGISDNYQHATLRDAARGHIKRSIPLYLCHCGHHDYIRPDSVEDFECIYCHRVGQWMAYDG
jgi:hypothetical protein